MSYTVFQYARGHNNWKNSSSLWIVSTVHSSSTSLPRANVSDGVFKEETSPSFDHTGGSVLIRSSVFIRNSSFVRSTCERLHIQNSTFRNSSFVRSTCERLHIQNSTFRNSSFVRSTCERLHTQNSTFRNSSFVRSTRERLHFLYILMHNLALINSSIEHLRSILRNISLARSTHERLHIENSTFIGGAIYLSNDTIKLRSMPQIRDSFFFNRHSSSDALQSLVFLRSSSEEMVQNFTSVSQISGLELASEPNFNFVPYATGPKIAASHKSMNARVPDPHCSIQEHCTVTNLSTNSSSVQRKYVGLWRPKQRCYRG